MIMVDVVAENNFGDTRSGGLAGPMGLFIIALLAIATVLLIRNMNARIRRLPDHFPDPGTSGGEARSGVDEAAPPTEEQGDRSADVGGQPRPPVP